MTVSITHAKVSDAAAPSDAALVGGPDWNDEHTVSGLSGQVLAFVRDTAGTSPSTTSSTQADIDASNAVITFTAPSSGNVIVEMDVIVNLGATVSAQNAFLGIRESTTNVIDKQFALQSPANVNVEQYVHFVGYITGLTPGSSHTYKAAYAVNGGITMTVRQLTASPLYMRVVEA